MSDPGYDFFATGRPQAPPGGPAVPEPPTAPPAPAQQAAPAAAQYGAPAPARTFQMPNGTQVNQFGTPIGEVAAPTGPYAAPGVAAVPTAAPGMVTTWGGPSPAGHRAAPQAVGPERAPRNVRAVAILAIVFGVLGALSTFAGFATYSSLSAQVATLDDRTGLVSGLMTAVLVGLVIFALVSATLLAGGIATLMGRRWGGWVLVGAFGLSLLGQVQQISAGGLGATQAIGFLIALALLLVLVTGEGLAWLQGKRA